MQYDPKSHKQLNKHFQRKMKMQNHIYVHSRQESGYFHNLWAIYYFQIFQALEHPVEEEKLLELQNLVIMERENFVRFIFNGSWNSVVHRENIGQ